MGLFDGARIDELGDLYRREALGAVDRWDADDLLAQDPETFIASIVEHYEFRPAKFR